MATEMSKTKGTLRFVILGLGLIAPSAVHAGCGASRNLSASVLKFEARQASTIEALIKFGEQNDLCFGIEYVDRSVLTKKLDFNIQNTTVRGAIETILGSRPLSIEPHFGVIEISQRRPKKKGLFDIVISKWVAQRGPLQMASWLLHVRLAQDLNPQIKGFAGDAAAGNAQDEVGPFSEVNQPLRYLLDKIVAQSKGASWIAQIPPSAAEAPVLPEDRRAWTIVEYQGPSADYARILNAVAAQLPDDTKAESPR
jgi:hypothetical protein